MSDRDFKDLRKRKNLVLFLVLFSIIVVTYYITVMRMGMSLAS